MKYGTCCTLVLAFVLSCAGDPVTDGLKGSGTIEATEIRVSPLISGRITELLCVEGQSVARGDLLAVLSADELSAELSRADNSINAATQQTGQAWTALKDAEVSLKRVREQFASGLVSQQALDSAETKLHLAEWQWKNAQAVESQTRSGRRALGNRYQETRLYAPIDGVVLARNYEAGETIFPGNTLVTLADTRALYLRIFVPENKLGSVAIGQRAVVRVDSLPGQNHPGTVSQIATKAEFTPKNVQTEDSRTRLVFAVKIALPNNAGKLKPGMPADGWLLGGK